jgi:hypothetical protein
VSVQSQIDAAAAGSTVTVAAGVHRENLYIGKPLKLVGLPGAIIAPSGGWNAITVKANNVTIEGLEIVNAPGDGIECDGVHHVTIRRCTARYCGESGIQFNRCDWFLVEDCTTYGNAETGWFSGISAWQNKVLAAGTLIGGFRNIIRNCICYGQNTWNASSMQQDGNGIVLDDFNNTQGGGEPGGYTHKTLIHNCLCYDNDGKGIHVVWTDNVTVRLCTCVNNSLNPLNPATWLSEISVAHSKNVTLDRNIAVCSRGAGSLANKRAYNNTSPSWAPAFNTTKWAGNVGWDAASTPSIRLDIGNAAPSSAGLKWLNPKLANYVPTVATAAGWRPLT